MLLELAKVSNRRLQLLPIRQHAYRLLVKLVLIRSSLTVCLLARFYCHLLSTNESTIWAIMEDGKLNLNHFRSVDTVCSILRYISTLEKGID